MSGYYDRQTCINGHIVSNYVGASFGTTQPFCAKCGAATIINCPTCQTPQRGLSLDEVSVFKGAPDAFCRNCGKPYPWTERQLEAAGELVKEEAVLSEADKAILTAALPDLMSNTPRTTLAAMRFKRIVGSAGKGFREAMYRFLVDFSSETAKKIVMGE